MAQETKITCDVDGCELKGRDMVEMSTVNAMWNHVKDRPIKNPETGKIEMKSVVFHQTPFSFHIGKEHSEEFFKYLKAFFEKKNKQKALRMRMRPSDERCFRPVLDRLPGQLHRVPVDMS